MVYLCLRLYPYLKDPLLSLITCLKINSKEGWNMSLYKSLFWLSIEQYTSY